MGEKKRESAKTRTLGRGVSYRQEDLAYDYGCNSGSPLRDAGPTIPTHTPHCMQEDPACNEPVVNDSSYPLNSHLSRHAQVQALAVF